MDIIAWRKEIQTCFPEYVLPAEIGLSVVCQLFIKDIKHPFGLIYVDVSGSGKTIVLNFFSSLNELVYATDSLTKASFVSQSARKSSLELATEVDLLPKIKDKLLLVRDLAPLFSKREDELTDILGQFIRVLDGQGYTNNGGVHGTRGYVGEYNFMFLGASTPITRRVWNIINRAGSRLLTYNLDNPDKSIDELAEQNVSEISLFDKERRCREITSKLVHKLKKNGPIVWSKDKEDKVLMRDIARMANLLACLRGVINEDKFTDTEKSDRLNSLLYNFARGHALACERININLEDLCFVAKIVLSSALMPRVKVMKQLILNEGTLTTTEIMEVLKFTRPIAIKYMRELKYLNVVSIKHLGGDVGRPEKIIKLLDRWSWFLGERFRRLMANP